MRFFENTYIYWSTYVWRTHYYNFYVCFTLTPVVNLAYFPDLWKVLYPFKSTRQRK